MTTSHIEKQERESKSKTVRWTKRINPRRFNNDTIKFRKLLLSSTRRFLISLSRNTTFIYLVNFQTPSLIQFLPARIRGSIRDSLSGFIDHDGSPTNTFTI